ncbi:hypothetical protein V8C37DRAFT_380049 [Trichoderma ceciliae]
MMRRLQSFLAWPWPLLARLAGMVLAAGSDRLPRNPFAAKYRLIVGPNDPPQGGYWRIRRSHLPSHWPVRFVIISRFPYLKPKPKLKPRPTSTSQPLAGADPTRPYGCRGGTYRPSGVKSRLFQPCRWS